MVSLIGTATRAAILATGFALAVPACAQSAPSKDAPPVASAPLPVAVPAALDDAVLADARGGQVVVIGNQALTSSIAGSTINGNYAAGAINFSDNALSNFSGIGNVVVNTGAQANLQSAMNLTINLGN